MKNDQRHEYPAVLSQFLYYMETIKNLSSRTVDAYAVDLRTFFRFILLRRGRVPVGIDPDKQFDEISIQDISVDDVKRVTTADVYEFLHYVTRDRENAAATRARKVSCLRSFYKYATQKAHLFEENPMEEIEVPNLKKSLPKFLSLEEALELLNSAGGDFETRDYCMLTLFMNCGMRLSELVGMNVTDVRGDTARIVGKGNKERTVYLNDACQSALEAYLAERNSEKYAKRPGENALFLSKRGTRLTGRRVEQIIDECLKRAGLSGLGYSVHKLRHTAATLMYRHGDVDMLALKEILGHAHVSTTEIYTHIDDRKLKNAVDSSPLASVKKRKKAQQ